MSDNLFVIYNEVFLVVLAGVVFSISLFSDKKSTGKLEVIVTSLGLLALFFLSFLQLSPSQGFGGVYSSGQVTVIFKQLFLLAGLWISLLSWPSDANSAHSEQMGEFLGLLLLSITGMSVLVSAQELVLLYTGIELATMPLILLTAFHRKDIRSAEASMKYVLFSALSSGLLLYGLSLVYGMTGTTFMAKAANQLSSSPLTILSLILIFAGVGFKIGAAPFHMWAPDTYEGAPISVTAFLSVASKAAGFALFYKLITALFPASQALWWVLLAIMATLTMTIGNLAALHQTNMKRFLAYSSIAQAGYLIMGLTQGAELGLTSVIFYLWIYLASNMAAFAVVILIEAKTGFEDMRDYIGLSETNPKLSLVMMLAMFSLAGIPPLAGFLGKFYLFAAASAKGLYWLVFIGAINATISLYYYLIVIKWMYIVKPAENQARIASIEIPWSGNVVLFTTSAAMLLFGVLPQFIRWTELAASIGF